MEVERRVSEMEKRARFSNESIAEIVTQAVVTASAPVAVTTTAESPPREYLSRTVQRVQHGANPQLPDPPHRKDLVLSAVFQETLKGQQFLLHDSGGKKRFLIFATTENLETLASCDIWMCDGTFQTDPKIFYQLYSIHGYKGNRVIPLGFVLMTKKTEKMYTKVFDCLKSAQLLLSPKHIMIDYEKTFMSSCLKSFPGLELDGCFFHFAQCVWRHVQQEHLNGSYGESIQFAFRVRMLIALAFVPVDNVINVFESLVASNFFSKDQDISIITKYFERTWIGRVGHNGIRQELLMIFRKFDWICS